MNRQFLRMRPAPLSRVLPARATPANLLSRTYATSSPPKAEKASAESGGSRSQDVRGRTGGGKPLEASKSPPPQPKIHNASVPGQKEGLSKEQQKEIDDHNREFEKKHGRATSAQDDKVDKKFWQQSGRGGK